MANKTGKFKNIQQRDAFISLRLSKIEIEYIDTLCAWYKDRGAKDTSRADIIVKLVTADLTRKEVFM